MFATSDSLLDMKYIYIIISCNKTTLSAKNVIWSAKRDFAGVMSPLVLGKGRAAQVVVCLPTAPCMCHCVWADGLALEEAGKKIILTAGICHWVSLGAYLMSNFIQLAQLCIRGNEERKKCWSGPDDLLSENYMFVWYNASKFRKWRSGRVPPIPYSLTDWQLWKRECCWEHDKYEWSSRNAIKCLQSRKISRLVQLVWNMGLISKACYDLVVADVFGRQRRCTKLNENK